MPQGAFDYIRPALKGPDYSASVLMIVASNNSISSAAADYYQAARGLFNHRLEFTLAELQALATGPNAVIMAVADYIIAHGITHVVATPGVPASTSATGHCIEMILADSVWWAYGTQNPDGARSFGRVTCESGSDYEGPIGFNRIQNPAMTWLNPAGLGEYIAQTGDIKDLFLARDAHTTYNNNGTHTTFYNPCAWGRLGCPHHSTLVTLAEVQRMIDDCIWAENQAVSGKVLALGFGDYTAQGVHELQWYAWQMAKAYGLATNYYIEGSAGSGGRKLPTAVFNDLSAWMGKQPDYNSAAFYAGTASVAADVYLGSAVINDGIAGSGSTAYKNYWNSLAPKRGAWCFNWCSSGFQMSTNVMLKGGAAGIGPMKEPFTTGLPEDASMMALALQGYSLAEICWLIPGNNFAMTVWGDPLYRPFPAQGLPYAEIMSVQPITPAFSVNNLFVDRSIAAYEQAKSITNTTPIRETAWRS